MTSWIDNLTDRQILAAWRRTYKAMSDEEFERILNGPLAHPLFIMRLNRLAIALKAVVEATGEAGAQALRDHVKEEPDQSDEGFPA